MVRLCFMMSWFASLDMTRVEISTVLSLILSAGWCSLIPCTIIYQKAISIRPWGSLLESFRFSMKRGSSVGSSWGLELEMCKKFLNSLFLKNQIQLGGECWSVQCEVLRHKPPSFFLPQQDQVPENNVIEHAMPFDFFGLGQPIEEQQNDND